MTLLLVGEDKQSFITPELVKVYSNKDYKVLKSTFVGHEYLIVNRRTKKVALVPSYKEVNLTKLKFEYKILLKY
jgi:hypothetical protein